MAATGGQIDSVMQETRMFPPPAEFASKAKIGSLAAYQQLYDAAKADPVAFWEALGRSELHWFKPFEKTLVWDEPFAQWFVGGQTNASYNCVDIYLSGHQIGRAHV